MAIFVTSDQTYPLPTYSPDPRPTLHDENKLFFLLINQERAT